MILDIKLNIKPLSVNEAHYRNKKRTVKYLNYIEFWRKAFEKRGIKSIAENKSAKYSITFVFGFSNRGSDIDNPIKVSIDTLQGLLKFNDKQIYMIGVSKDIVPKGEEYIKVKMQEIPNGKES